MILLLQKERLSRYLVSLAVYTHSHEYQYLHSKQTSTLLRFVVRDLHSFSHVSAQALEHGSRTASAVVSSSAIMVHTIHQVVSLPLILVFARALALALAFLSSTIISFSLTVQTVHNTTPLSSALHLALARSSLNVVFLAPLLRASNMQSAAQVVLQVLLRCWSVGGGGFRLRVRRLRRSRSRKRTPRLLLRLWRWFRLWQWRCFWRWFWLWRCFWR